MPISIQDIILVQTSIACPEQYDAFIGNKKLVGYLRLRHGYFRVDVPDCGDETIYTAKPKGDGCFTDDEQDFYLNKAKESIVEWYNKNN